MSMRSYSTTYQGPSRSWNPVVPLQAQIVEREVLTDAQVSSQLLDQEVLRQAEVRSELHLRAPMVEQEMGVALEDPSSSPCISVRPQRQRRHSRRAHAPRSMTVSSYGEGTKPQPDEQSPLGAGPACFHASALFTGLLGRRPGEEALLEELLDGVHFDSLAQPELELREIRAGHDALASLGIHLEASGVEHLKQGCQLALLEPFLAPFLAPLLESLFDPLSDILARKLALVLVVANLHQLLQGFAGRLVERSQGQVNVEAQAPSIKAPYRRKYSLSDDRTHLLVPMCHGWQYVRSVPIGDARERGTLTVLPMG